MAAIKDYPGITGKTSFAENGEALKEVIILKVEKRQIQPRKVIRLETGEGAGFNSPSPASKTFKLLCQFGFIWILAEVVSCYSNL